MRISRRNFMSGMSAAMLLGLLPKLARASSPEVIIIGAGVAGLTAAMMLARQGISFRLLEGRGRRGGRAYTSTTEFALPYDMGAAWLHQGESNPFVQVAARLGTEIVNVSAADSWLYLDGTEASSAQYKQFAFLQKQLAQLIEQLGDNGRDEALGAVFKPESGLMQLAASTFAEWEAGVDWSALSSLDLYQQHTGEVEYRVPSGVGALLQNWARLVPAELDCVVSAIDMRSNKDVRVETNKGTLTAQYVLLTVPPSVLAAEKISFMPVLPLALREAHAQIKMGHLNKLALQFTKPLPETAANTTLYSLRGDSSANILLAPLGHSMAEISFGGQQALDLLQAGKDAAIEEFMPHLTALYGSNVKDTLKASHITNWANDVFSLGSYSAAKPGFARARELLAEPISDRVYYAGEAASTEHAATLHGAYNTAQAAAKIIMSKLKR